MNFYTFCLIATFAIVAIAHGSSDAYSAETRKEVISYLLSSPFRTIKAEEELKGKTTGELIDMTIDLLKKNRETHLRQAPMIDGHLAYYLELKAKATPDVKYQGQDDPTSKIRNVRSEDYFYEQIRNAGNRLVLVNFSAKWCGPCKNIAPRLEQLAEHYGSKVILLKVDVDELNDLAMFQFRVSAMPTFVFMKYGKTVERFSGADAGRVEYTIRRFI